MGTNFYRIPREVEMRSRKEKLINELYQLDMTPSTIQRNFSLPIENSWETESPWDRFIGDTSVHLGKRSGGWKFCWNFHKNKYYSNKEQLLEFIRIGRVVDEYGKEWGQEEFIEMALNWCQPDGLVLDKSYRNKMRLQGHGTFWADNEKYDDLIIDGLRVSTSTEFS